MKKCFLLALPASGHEGMEDRVSDVLGKAPTFTFVEIVDGVVRDVRVEENEASNLSHGAGPIAMKKLKEEGVDAVATVDAGPGAKTLLELSGIRMNHVEPQSRVSEATEKALMQLLTKGESVILSPKGRTTHR
jgi:predicted Fe-Mo cluster-binding NifX family protein